MTIERVAVTGIGVVSALGRGARECFERMLLGERGFAPVSLFDTTGLRSRIAAEVSDLKLDEPGAAATHSRTDALALFAAREALQCAGLSPEPGTLGLVLGGTAGTMLEAENELVGFGVGARSSERARRLVSEPLAHTVWTLEKHFGTLSAASTVCSACSSGAAAIVQAAHWIRSGRAQAVLAGGADGLCRMTFVGFNALGALDPAPCRPFDVGRQGLTLGEAGAFLVLESERAARRRGARVLAWLSGWALGAEAHHGTHPEPSGRRAAELMRAALGAAKLTAADIDYVNAHGTATRHNDSMEAAAIRLALGSEVSRVAVSSSKAQFGHTLGAAGALEAAITVFALQNRLAPATVGLDEPEDAGLNHVTGSFRPGVMRAALSNSFGFGGMDAVLLFEAAESAPRAAAELASSVVVTGFAQLRTNSDARDELDPDRSRRFDRLTAEAARGAMEALDSAHLGPSGVGLVLGNAYGNVERSLRFLDRLLFLGPRHAPPAEFPHLLHSAPAGHASIYLGLDGPVFSVSEGELGAEGALASAEALLALGIAPAVLAGALETEDALVTELQPLADGRARGSGGGFLVLERLAFAEERGVEALCRICSHVEERGRTTKLDKLDGPANVARARVVLSGDHSALSDHIESSAWRGASKLHIPGATAPGHEALGASALIAGVELVRSGEADEVLVGAGGASRRYWTRLCSLGKVP